MLFRSGGSHSSPEGIILDGHLSYHSPGVQSGFSQPSQGLPLFWYLPNPKRPGTPTAVHSRISPHTCFFTALTGSTAAAAEPAWTHQTFSFLSCLDLAGSPGPLLEPTAQGRQKQLILLYDKDQDAFLIVISIVLRPSPTVFWLTPWSSSCSPYNDSLPCAEQ